MGHLAPTLGLFEETVVPTVSIWIPHYLDIIQNMYINLITVFIFRKPGDGQTKIILSTNVAETSITIEDCIFVIDTGKMKQKSFDANTNIESLDTIWVSKANALQRKGRAGRVRKGVCIHLYTKHRFEYNFIPHPISEILRIPVDSLILYMKILINYNYKNIDEVFSK